MTSGSFKITYTSSEDAGKVTWRCPSNIALIKYWGKREHQLPSSPSLSFTLSESFTETTIEFEYIEAINTPGIHFISENTDDKLFEKRVIAYIENLIIEIPILSKLRLHIRSRNNFPHSAGIASSASAFGAIALCLCSIEMQITGSVSGTMDFFRKASYLARLGSGSACRSIYGGYVVWGETQDESEFSNQFALPLPFEVHPVFRHLQDTILIVSSQKKTLSSSAGHDLMKSHPYAYCRYDQARDNLVLLSNALQTGDIDIFVKIVENEALSLHALLMSSENGHILLKPESLAIINKVVEYRRSSGIPICFTIDAGPNIHLIYPLEQKEKITSFIQAELLGFCENAKFIDDRIGTGPVKL